MQPAVDERLRGRLRLVPVARAHARAADQDLADAGLGIGLIDRDFGVRRREPHRIRVVRRPLMGQERRDRRALRQAEPVADARTIKPLLDLMDERGRDRRAPVRRPSDGRHHLGRELRVIEDVVVDRGDRDTGGDALGRERVDHPWAVEADVDHGRAAKPERRQHLAVAPCSLREHVHRALAGVRGDALVDRADGNRRP
ncbi:MAG TPA: hypothetical protein VMU39_01865 [Solirubrobacteraceae bacterium]|nr:hypothetical protein [Solirubrobacteraceae bacterium]